MAEPARGRKGSDTRLSELDGLRALAVMGVVCFHYLARYEEYYPYGSVLSPFTRHGGLGVALFFVISGFVIALTLRVTRSPLDFLVRRLARLLPAMMVCSLLTFAVVHLIDTPFTRAIRVGPEGFLPSWTFTAPMLWQKFLPGADYIDGAYWSLFVEIRFYFWAALLYFVGGSRRFAPIFLACAALFLAVYPLVPDTSFKTALLLLFFPVHLPLFCIGIAAQELYRGDRAPWLYGALALFTGLAAWYAEPSGPVPTIMVTAITACFLALVFARGWLRPLGHPALVHIGLCSYSLYLLHEYIGVALITTMPRDLPGLWHGAGVLLVAAGMLALSTLVYRFVERPGQRLARVLLDARRNWNAGRGSPAQL